VRVEQQRAHKLARHMYTYIHIHTCTYIYIYIQVHATWRSKKSSNTLTSLSYVREQCAHEVKLYLFTNSRCILCVYEYRQEHAASGKRAATRSRTRAPRRADFSPLDYCYCKVSHSLSLSSSLSLSFSLFLSLSLFLSFFLNFFLSSS